MVVHYKNATKYTVDGALQKIVDASHDWHLNPRRNKWKIVEEIGSTVLWTVNTLSSRQCVTQMNHSWLIWSIWSWIEINAIIPLKFTIYLAPSRLRFGQDPRFQSANFSGSRPFVHASLDLHFMIEVYLKRFMYVKLRRHWR